MKQDIWHVESLELSGLSTAKNDQNSALIWGGLPGEDLEVNIGERNVGTIQKIVKSASSRVKPLCPHYADCGGCTIMHAAYPLQLDMKTAFVTEQLAKQGLPTAVVLPAIGMKDPFFYRTKAQMTFSEKGSKVLAGFYEENTHRIVNVDRCFIQNDQANQIVKTLKGLLVKHKIKPYLEDKETGLFRHVVIRVSESTKQILVTFVTSEEKFPGRNNVVQDLLAAHPEITTIVQNVNPRKTSVGLGAFERVLYGPGHIEDELMGLKFRIASKTFYQVNHRQTQVLYQKALELAKPKKEDVVVDAYAGVGTIGLMFASQVKEVLGVEINPASVSAAIVNSKLNGIRNVRFYKDDAIRFLTQLAEEKKHVDIVVFDPPRSGLVPGFVGALALLKPKKIVYVSCDPTSLARDIRQIVDQGYELKRVQPVDMFCHTQHVETVSLLSIKLPYLPSNS
jgi:23S rRNA (uracil1939-C5)-methyltransferase